MIKNNTNRLLLTITVENEKVLIAYKIRRTYSEIKIEGSKLKHK